MVVETYWLGTGAFATVMTLAWLFIPIRITLTTLLSAGAWSFMALSGGSIVRYTETGAEVPLDAGVLQYLCTFLAIISFVAAVLHYFGHFPPEDDGEMTDPTEVNPDVAD